MPPASSLADTAGPVEGPAGIEAACRSKLGVAHASGSVGRHARHADCWSRGAWSCLLYTSDAADDM
eukprot:11935304-Alexandrium_andersonii.AAC.1